MDRGSWNTYNIHLNWVTRWMSVQGGERERMKESWAINLVGCRQTKFSVCWFIKNTMRKWNSNGVRIFQLDSKFYCWRFFIRAWNAPTHESTCEHTPAHTFHTLHNGTCASEKLPQKRDSASVQSFGLLVFSAMKNSIDAIHLLLLLLLYAMAEYRWNRQTKKTKVNNQWTERTFS